MHIRFYTHNLAQNALIQSQEERIKDKETIIALQAESRKTLEAQSRYVEPRYVELIEAKDTQLIAAQDDARMLRSQIEASRKVIKHYEDEAMSYERAFFGLYRKKKGTSDGSQA